MDLMIKEYQKIIDRMYSEACKHETYDKDANNVIRSIFKNFKEKINQVNNKLQIIMDNDFAKAIIGRVRDSEEKYSSDFKKFEAIIKYLSFLAFHVTQEKFITKREKRKVDDCIIKIKESKQYKLNSKMAALMNSLDQDEFREDFFDALGISDVSSQDDQRAARLYQDFYTESIKNLDKKLLVKIDSIISKYENRKEILKEMIVQVDQYLGQDIGTDDKELVINRQLIKIAESENLTSNQQHFQLLQEQYKEIQHILNRFSAMKLFSAQKLKIELHLAKFGSIVSGFATRNTDMDLTILTNCYIKQIELLQYLQAFLKAEFKQKKNIQSKVGIVKNARIPLIKLEITTNRGKTDIDIIINNILGVINSQFLSVYGSVRWIKQLGLLIKLWAKKKQLIKEELFSSYSLNLMLLHFLIETQRASLILDAHHRHPEKTPHFIHRRLAKNQLEQFPVYFQFKTKPEDVTDFKRVNIYEVLTQFFEYYSEGGKHWKFSKEESIITVDGQKNKEFDDTYVFTIKDPFDKMHNPGRVKIGFKTKVMDSFADALKAMKSKQQRQIMDLLS